MNSVILAVLMVGQTAETPAEPQSVLVTPVEVRVPMILHPPVMPVYVGPSPYYVDWWNSHYRLRHGPVRRVLFGRYVPRHPYDPVRVNYHIRKWGWY